MAYKLFALAFLLLGVAVVQATDYTNQNWFGTWCSDTKQSPLDITDVEEVDNDSNYKLLC
jgi:hypothetical protein